MNKQKVICVGSAGKDIFFPIGDGVVLPTSDTKIKTPEQWCFGYGAKIHVEDRFEAPGGCACNVSVGLSRLGVETAAYGLIGGDSDGVWIREQLSHDGVDVEHLRTLEGQKTDLSGVLVRVQDAERTIVVNRDVSEHLIFDCAVLEKYDWIYLSSVYGHATEQNMLKLHDLICKNDVRLAYNPGMQNIRENIDLVCDLIHHATLVFVNKTEAQMILKGIDSEKSCRIDQHSDHAYNESQKEFAEEICLLQALSAHTDGQATVVLTDGQRGAWALSDDVVSHASINNGARIDTTGAGDAFASGYVAALLSGATPHEALTWGSANSHNVIGYYGAHAGLLNKDSIVDEAQKFTLNEI